MSKVLLNWPGGEHDFALRIGELRALQDRCDAGPEEVFNRLRLGSWRVNDITETIRLGLIGGGMPQAKAGPLVAQMVESTPLVQFKLTAIAILAAALLGVADDPVGEPEGVKAAESGNSAGSTETAR